MDQYNEFLEQYELNNENYHQWRKIHEQQFGELFGSAFDENQEAQVLLTTALINISQRKFTEAMPKLDLLESICVKDFDMAAVCYFKGLNYEFLENEQKMNEYYEKLRDLSVPFAVTCQFNPYYRTAKFAQRASECKKAIHYYQKSLQFFDGITPSPAQAKTISMILYDIATVYLYEHKYDECEKFLDLSKQYDSSKNHQRDYVRAILYALQGKSDESKKIVKKLIILIKDNCERTVNAILEGRDPHYCVVPQDRSTYNAFWSSLSQNAPKIETLLADENTNEAEAIISKLLSETLAFMRRTIDCRIEKGGNSITVYCKNYNVKTLTSEYVALFEKKPTDLNNWNFVSIKEFADFNA